MNQIMKADFLNRINDPMATILVVLLSATGLYFTIKTKGAQFRMIGEMFRLLADGASSKKTGDGQRRISSLQAFFVSLASRVGTGNLAGVATAIVIGGQQARITNCKNLSIFPLKINWSHLSEVGERGIAVRWAYNMFTPRVRYCGVTE